MTLLSHSGWTPDAAIDDPIAVLHVDDEPDLAELAATYVERHADLTTTVATTAEEGLARLDEGSFDCIVSDFDMPQMNGLEFLDAVRADYPDLPFILYTGKGSEEVASDAISRNVTDYMQKGTGTDQYVVLANRIENAVAEARAQAHADLLEEHHQSLLDDVLDSSPVATFILDSEFNIVWVNRAVEDFFGLDREEILGMDKRRLIDKQIADSMEEPTRFAQTVKGTYDDNTNVEQFTCHILAEGDRADRWLDHRSQPITQGLYAGGRVEHYSDTTADQPQA